MDIIQMATELALAIQKDERYEYLEKARELNDKDEELQEQIGEFNLARIDLNAQMSKPERDNDKIQELNNHVNQIYAEIMQNESMAAYNESKREMDLLMQHINAIFTAAVNGADPTLVTPPSAGCAGDCGSCGGSCH